MRAFLLLFLLLAACERPLYPDTYEELMARHAGLPGTIFCIRGDTYGPFREVAVITGDINTPGAMEPARDLGERPRIAWPATPGYYYQGYKYESEAESPLYIIRKIPANNPNLKTPHARPLPSNSRPDQPMTDSR